MSLQWTAVACFLYGQIVVNLVLCFPLISAQRWRSLFNWTIWSWFSPYWNKAFCTMIMVLVVLFFDAVREVQKYSSPQTAQDATLNPTLFDHLHMKLFRAQRNLYISGFSLFLWLIMRRIVTLVNQVALATTDSAGLQAQMVGANQAATRYQAENLQLKQALQAEEEKTSAKSRQMEKEEESRARDLKAAEEVVRKARVELEAMRRQAKGLTQEYDRLLTEHTQLQNLQNTADKKDQ